MTTNTVLSRAADSKASGEKLTSVFPRNYFDICSCTNALDHCYDPIAAIRQMLAVCKPGGWLHLSHILSRIDVPELRHLPLVSASHPHLPGEELWISNRLCHDMAFMRYCDRALKGDVCSIESVTSKDTRREQACGV